MYVPVCACGCMCLCNCAVIKRHKADMALDGAASGVAASSGAAAGRRLAWGFFKAASELAPEFGG